MQQIINTIIPYLIIHWPHIVSYSIGGLTIAVVLQWLKRHFNIDQIGSIAILKFIRLDGPRLVVMLFSLMTALGTLLNWIVDPANAQYIPVKYAYLLTSALYIHRFLVSPAAVKLEAALQPYIQAFEQIKSMQTGSLPAATDPAASQTDQQPFSLSGK